MKVQESLRLRMDGHLENDVTMNSSEFEERECSTTYQKIVWLMCNL